MATLGSSPDAGLTVGAGLAGIGGDSPPDPAFVVGGDLRTSRRVKVILESYLFHSSSGSDGLLSGGVRIMGERVAADLGLLIPVGGGMELVLPLVNFSFGW